MVPLAKAAVKPENEGKASKLHVSHLVFHHLLYLLIEKNHNSALL